MLENENQMTLNRQEVLDLEKEMQIKTRETQRHKEETMVYKKQIDKLLEELKEKSDEESFDEDK